MRSQPLLRANACRHRDRSLHTYAISFIVLRSLCRKFLLKFPHVPLATKRFANARVHFFEGVEYDLNT